MFTGIHRQPRSNPLRLQFRNRYITHVASLTRWWNLWFVHHESFDAGADVYGIERLDGSIMVVGTSVVHGWEKLRLPIDLSSRQHPSHAIRDFIGFSLSGHACSRESLFNSRRLSGWVNLPVPFRNRRHLETTIIAITDPLVITPIRWSLSRLSLVKRSHFDRHHFEHRNLYDETRIERRSLPQSVLFLEYVSYWSDQRFLRRVECENRRKSSFVAYLW